VDGRVCNECAKQIEEETEASCRARIMDTRLKEVCLQRGETNRACFALSAKAWELAEQRRPHISVLLTYYTPNNNTKPRGARPCQVYYYIWPCARQTDRQVSGCYLSALYLYLSNSRSLPLPLSLPPPLVHTHAYAHAYTHIRPTTCTTRMADISFYVWNVAQKGGPLSDPGGALAPRMICRARNTKASII
jgi:hypothetical protein